MAHLLTKTTNSVETKIVLPAHYPYVWVRNLDADCYISSHGGIIAGDDDVALVPTGEAVRLITQTDSIYVLGATTIEVYGQGFADCPYAWSAGGGDVPVGAEIITRSAWDAMTTAQKQSKGLVAIQDSVSGYNRGVLVNGADYRDTLLQYSNYADILAEVKSDTHESGTAVWDTLTLSGEMDNASDGAVVTGGKTVSYSLSAANTDVTIYALMRRSSLTETGNRTMIGIPYSSSGDNLPNIFTNGAGVYTSVYGSDIMHPSFDSTEYTLYSMAVDATNKTVDFFADGTLIRSGVSFSNSGGYVVFGAANVELLNVLSCDIKFIGIVGAYEQATNIIANHNHIMDAYGM